MSDTRPLPYPFDSTWIPLPLRNTSIPISRTVCAFIENRGVRNLEIAVHGKLCRYIFLQYGLESRNVICYTYLKRCRLCSLPV